MASAEHSPPRTSQLMRLVAGSGNGEQQRSVGGHEDEVVVPWRAATIEEAQQLAVHYFTAAFNEFVGLDVVERDDEVRITVHERVTGSEQSGATRSASAVLEAPLGERRLVDGATGRTHEVFSPDAEAGWATFDLAAANWLLFAHGPEDLALAARTALADGCVSTALDQLADGHGELGTVYRERGIPPLNHRGAATLVANSALERAQRDMGQAEQVGPMLRELVVSGHLGVEQCEQAAPLIHLAEEIGKRLNTVGHAGKEFDRFAALVRDLQERGGFGAR